MQNTGLQNKMYTRLDQKFSPMQERYERLYFNASSCLEAEKEYFQHIHSFVLKSFNAHTKRIEMVNRSIHR